MSRCIIQVKKSMISVIIIRIIFMKETHQFLMPDYYENFSCKMGKCRSACCIGWPISVSMTNYFRLLGVECRKDLRQRLDTGLRIVDKPTEEEYARFEPRYDGNCPLRMHDGRCALHAELGEDILPDVCRLYPRGIRMRAKDGIYEISCANSCEAVLELLFEKHEKIDFIKREMKIAVPPHCEREAYFETFGEEEKIRSCLISIMQDRRYPLKERLMMLGNVLDEMDRAMDAHDEKMMRTLFSEEGAYAEKNRVETKRESCEISEEHIMFGLDTVEKMMTLLDSRSNSIRECGERALAFFGKDENSLSQYIKANGEFNAKFPEWETFFEHMLVNHMFFSVFPFQDRPENMHSEYTALCAVYVILRFLALGCSAEMKSRDDLTDIMASAFRLIDHTEFDRYSSHILQRLGCANADDLQMLTEL